MKFKTISRKFTISAIATAIVAATGSAAVAADPKVSAKGAIPTYPNCTALTGTAKSDCMAGKASSSETAAQVAPDAKAAAAGTAPKYPKQLKADGGVSVANTKKTVQGSAPQYPAKNDANGKPMKVNATTSGVAGSAVSGQVGTKGTAPKYPGKAATSEKAATMAEKKATGVPTAGAAPKYPAAKPVATGASDEAAKNVESTMNSAGVSPKFPQTK